MHLEQTSLVIKDKGTLKDLELSNWSFIYLMIIKHPLLPLSCLLWVPPGLVHVLRLEEERETVKENL